MLAALDQRPVGGGIAGIEQLLVNSNSVIQTCRERVLRRQPVVDRDDHHIGLRAGRQCPLMLGLDRAHTEAPAVDVDNQRRRGIRLRPPEIEHVPRVESIRDVGERRLGLLDTRRLPGRWTGLIAAGDGQGEQRRTRCKVRRVGQPDNPEIDWEDPV